MGLHLAERLAVVSAALLAFACLAALCVCLWAGGHRRCAAAWRRDRADPDAEAGVPLAAAAAPMALSVPPPVPGGVPP